MDLGRFYQKNVFKNLHVIIIDLSYIQIFVKQLKLWNIGKLVFMTTQIRIKMVTNY